jgi:hypothetical protein
MFRWFGNDPRYEVQFKERFKTWEPAVELATRPGTYCRIRLREPRPLGGVEPFVVRHYAGEIRPSIKGNGFDGLEVGETREEAEAFVAWLNERLGV